MSAQESLSIILNQPGFPRARPLSSDSKAGITEERATELINYQRNLEELRNTLSQVDSLLAEPPTPEIAAKCASLLGYVAAIDLPQEVKNQEAGRYPPQVQEQVHRALETQGTSTTRSAEAAAYGTAIMQRVAEEAQVRIQLEAKAAYEESCKVYEQQMQAYEMAFENSVKEFMDGPCTKERIEQLRKDTDKRNRDMEEASRADDQRRMEAFEHLSRKDQQVALDDLHRKIEQLTEQEAEARRKEQEHLKQASQYPEGSTEWQRQMALAEVYGKRAVAFGNAREQAEGTAQLMSDIMNGNEQSMPKQYSEQKGSSPKLNDTSERGVNIPKVSQPTSSVCYDQEKEIALLNRSRSALQQMPGVTRGKDKSMSDAMSVLTGLAQEMNDPGVMTVTERNGVNVLKASQRTSSASLDQDQQRNTSSLSGEMLATMLASQLGAESSDLDRSVHLSNREEVGLSRSSVATRTASGEMLAAKLLSQPSTVSQVKESELTDEAVLSPNIPIQSLANMDISEQKSDGVSSAHAGLKDRISENGQSVDQDASMLIRNLINGRSMG